MGQIAFHPFNPERDGKLVTAFARDIFIFSFGNDRRFKHKFGPDGQGYVPWLERGGREAFLAYEGDDPVGMVVLREYKHDPPLGYVVHYYLVEQARGRSLGDELDAFACRYLHDKGFPRALLAVSLSNIRAVRFYHRLGWVDVGPSRSKPGLQYFEKTLS